MNSESRTLAELNLLQSWQIFQTAQPIIAWAISDKIRNLLESVQDKTSLAIEMRDSVHFVDLHFFVQTHVHELGLADHPSDEELAHWMRVVGRYVSP